MIVEFIEDELPTPEDEQHVDSVRVWNIFQGEDDRCLNEAARRATRLGNFVNAGFGIWDELELPA